MVLDSTPVLLADVLLERGLFTMTSVSVLIIVSLGLTVIYGFMGVINLAHGAMLMIGAYVAYSVQVAGFPAFSALVLAPLVVGALGYLLEITIIKRLYDDVIKAVLVTWGIAIILREVVTFLYGTDRLRVERPLSGGFELAGTRIPFYWLFIILLSIAILALVWGVIKYTDTGTMALAVIQDRTMANSMGINARRMDRLSFAFGSALAGLGGAVAAPLGSVSTDMGLSYLIDAFLVVVVGGVGTIVGTLAGGIVIGGLDETLNWVFSQNLALAELLLYLAAVGIMLLKPDGLVGGGLE